MQPSTRLMLCLALSFLIARPVHARKKHKKGELAISKRGKLVFEDDFSSKELLWSFDRNRCEWKLTKKALLTRSGGTSSDTTVHRPYAPLRDVVLEFRALLPMQGDVSLFYKGGIRDTPWAKVFVTPNAQFAIYVGGEGGTRKALALSPLVYRKPRWLEVAFEVIGSRYALTVDGRTIVCDFPNPDRGDATAFAIGMNKKPDDVFAIDDVKVHEALPKDEDRKNKKKH